MLVDPISFLKNVICVYKRHVQMQEQRVASITPFHQWSRPLRYSEKKRLQTNCVTAQIAPKGLDRIFEPTADNTHFFFLSSPRDFLCKDQSIGTKTDLTNINNWNFSSIL